MQMLNLSTYSWLTVAAIILFAVISFILKHNTDSTTVYADATITSLSLVAQWMMSKKYLQHWILWIIIDVISINLYISKSLYLTSFLYSVFMLLCIKGYYQWRQAFSKSICFHSLA